MTETRFPVWKPAEDRELFALYETQYFEPGWAGELTDDQMQYIRNVLTGMCKNRRVRNVGKLRRAWGMRPWQSFISEEAVRAVAMYGQPDDPDHNMRLIEKSILKVLARLIA